MRVFILFGSLQGTITAEGVDLLYLAACEALYHLRVLNLFGSLRGTIAAEGVDIIWQLARHNSSRGCRAIRQLARHYCSLGR